MAIYEFGGDPDLTEQLYEFFRANVGNTVPCEISDANAAAVIFMGTICL